MLKLDMTLADFKRRLLVSEAERWAKIFELGGNHNKIMNQLLAKGANTGKETWPISTTFLKTCLEDVDQFVKTLSGSNELPYSVVVEKDPMNTWEKSSHILRTRFPKVGDIVVWGYFSQGKITAGGHVGIIKEILPNGQLVCIEGFMNAGQDPVIRAEEGIYTIVREQIGYTNMKIMGYISPWSFA
jgi:hypothetical protein